MMRGLTISMMLVAAALEPVMGSPDLVKYAITQGGLLFVVLVLLWFYRRDLLRISQHDEDKASVLVTLVQQNTQAMTQAAAASTANEQAANRLASAVERLEGRR